MEEKWKKLEENIPSDNAKEIVGALKELYSLFDDGLVYWFANLFDPEMCAFYWSNSARDTVGYMPSLEETYGALSFISESGMAEKYGGNWTKAIPKWLRDGARDYFLSLQDEDGFFYNRRWNKEFIAEHGLQNRMMRDVDTATRMLKALGATPKYDRKKPEPKKAEAKKEEKQEPKMLRQFESPENFSAYLNAFKERYENESDPNKRAFVFYSAGGEFQSTRGYIAEPEFRKIFFDFLKDTQDPNTGLWADTVCYGATNSLHKIAYVYNALGEKMPNVDKMVEGVMKIISLGKEDAPAPGAVDVYNAWSCLPYIYTNILRYGDGDEEERVAKKNAIKARVFELAPEAIRKGEEQLRVFKQADGGFSYNRIGNQVMAQGCRISVSGAKESDVNGTAIATLALKHHIFLALELEKYEIPLFSDRELKIFNSEIERIKREGAPMKKRLDYVALTNAPDYLSKKLIDRLAPIASITATVTDEAAPSKREIVLGHSERNITEIAKTRLEEKLKDAPDGSVGFSIVTVGPSIAVVWSDERVAEAAVDYLVSEYPTADTVKVFPLLPYLKERGERIKNKQWKALEERLGKEHGPAIVCEFRKLYDIFSESIVTWFANLYEPKTGGFYWSNSARDTIGYLPSLEETYAAVSFVQASGMAEMFGDDWVNAIPEWMKKKIVDFFYPLQDEDSFFYLPQWPKEYVLENNLQSRITRDRGSAKEVLRRLGVAPKYQNPPIKAEPTEKKESSAPKMLWQYENVENFRKYLENIEEEYAKTTDPVKRSWFFYNYGNQFQSTTNYLNANQEIKEEFIKFFEKHQSPETGMWCDKICFNATNGLHKIASVMNSIGHRMKHIDKMVETTMKIISLSPEENPATGGVDIYNAWSCFPYIYYNILHFGEESEEERLAKKEQIKRLVFKNAPETIRLGTAQMLAFKRSDGAYSYGRYGSVARAQGAPISLRSSTPESDVNGTCIAASALKRHIFMALEAEDLEIPLYTEYERTLFMNEIERIRREGAPPKKKAKFTVVCENPDDSNVKTLIERASEIIEVDEVITPDKEPRERELIVCVKDRTASSAELAARLAKALESAGDGATGYALSSPAPDAHFVITWSDERSADAAIEHFVKRFPCIDTVKVLKN